MLCMQVADNKYQLLQMNLCDGIMLQEAVDDQGDKLAIAINSIFSKSDD